jgi:hypothetical protein
MRRQATSSLVASCLWLIRRLIRQPMTSATLRVECHLSGRHGRTPLEADGTEQFFARAFSTVVSHHTNPNDAQPSEVFLLNWRLNLAFSFFLQQQPQQLVMPNTMFRQCKFGLGYETSIVPKVLLMDVGLHLEQPALIERYCREEVGPSKGQSGSRLSCHSRYLASCSARRL